MTKKSGNFRKIQIFRKLDLLSKFCLVTFSFPSQTWRKRQKWHSRLTGSELPRSKSTFGSKIRSDFPKMLPTFLDFIRPLGGPHSTQNIAQSTALEEYVLKMPKLFENGPVVENELLFKLVRLTPKMLANSQES